NRRYTLVENSIPSSPVNITNLYTREFSLLGSSFYPGFRHSSANAYYSSIYDNNEAVVSGAASTAVRTHNMRSFNKNTGSNAYSRIYFSVTNASLTDNNTITVSINNNV